MLRSIHSFLSFLGFDVIDPDVEYWSISADDSENLSLDVLSDIYDEAQLRFISIVDDITLVRNRAYTLITLFITLMSLLVSLYFSQTTQLVANSSHVLSLLFLINILVIAYVIIQCVLIFKPNNIMVKGEEPSLMNYNGLAKLNTQEQKRIYILNSIEALQGKILFNETILTDKNDRLEKIVFIVLFAFLFTLIFAIFLPLI